MPQLRLSHLCHRERGVRGVSSVVCYAVLCPWSGGLCGLLCRVMPWSRGRVLFPAISRLIRLQVRSSRVQFGTKNDAAGYTLFSRLHNLSLVLSSCLMMADLIVYAYFKARNFSGNLTDSRSCIYTFVIINFTFQLSLIRTRPIFFAFTFHTFYNITSTLQNRAFIVSQSHQT